MSRFLFYILDTFVDNDEGNIMIMLRNNKNINGKETVVLKIKSLGKLALQMWHREDPPDGEIK